MFILDVTILFYYCHEDFKGFNINVKIHTALFYGCHEEDFGALNIMSRGIKV